MIKVIGKINCSKCDMVKKLLENNNIKYEYKLLDNMQENERKLIINIAKKQKIFEFPLVFKDDKLITLDELVDFIK